MSEMVRMSMTIEKSLNEKLEKLMVQKGGKNRSEFLRDLIRDRLVQEEWENNNESLGTITLIYDHHTQGIGDKLTEIQHKHHTHVLASTHLHLTHEMCAEAIMIKGKSGEIRKIADSMGNVKGVLHSALSMSSTGESLK